MVELRDEEDGRVALIMDREELPAAIEAFLRSGYQLTPPSGAGSGGSREGERQAGQRDDEAAEPEDREGEAEAEPEEAEAPEEDADEDREPRSRSRRVRRTHSS